MVNNICYAVSCSDFSNERWYKSLNINYFGKLKIKLSISIILSGSSKKKKGRGKDIMNP